MAEVKIGMVKSARNTRCPRISRLNNKASPNPPRTVIVVLAITKMSVTPMASQKR